MCEAEAFGNHLLDGGRECVRLWRPEGSAEGREPTPDSLIVLGHTRLLVVGSGDKLTDQLGLGVGLTRAVNDLAAFAYAVRKSRRAHLF
jgi:hypothetical protein